MTKYIVATATTSIYFYETQQLLNSLNNLLPQTTEVIIYDNGLLQSQIVIITTKFNYLNITLIKRYLTIYEQTSYYFKTIAHKYIREKYENCVYIWLDAKTMLKYDCDELELMLINQPVYSHKPFNEAEDLWTDKRTMDLMEIDEKDRKTPQYQASAMMFDLRTNKGIDFLDKLIDYNNDKDILTPRGTKKGFKTPTHRQDQSVFSCLLKKYGYTKNPSNWAICHNTIHKIN